MKSDFIFWNAFFEKNQTQKQSSGILQHRQEI